MKKKILLCLAGTAVITLTWGLIYGMWLGGFIQGLAMSTLIVAINSIPKNK